MDMGKLFLRIAGTIDQARPFFSGKVGEQPLHRDDDPIAEPDQVHDVDKAPGEPGDIAAELDLAEHADRFGFTDRRHGPFVQVGERGALGFGKPFANDLRDVAPFLNSDGSKRGERLALLVESASGVADDEDFRMLGDG